jgi:hypothetical protein
MALDSASLRRVISKTADEIVKAAKRPSQNSPRRKIVWGTVTEIHSGSPATLTIMLAGGTVDGVTYLSWYSPTVDDYVMCERYGTDLVCYGTLAS